jgi:hypothetical protein
MLTHLRKDEGTGAIFAGIRSTVDLAVVHLATTPRDGDDPRGPVVEGYAREWLDSLPDAVKTVSAWAASPHDVSFFEKLGFQADAPALRDGARAMTLSRPALRLAA